MDDGAEARSTQESTTTMLSTRAYQQEMLDQSLRSNIIIALDTGSGKTHIAVLRIKHELEREAEKASKTDAVCWFLAPTVALCQQQATVIKSYLPYSVGIVSGAHQPEQWKKPTLWQSVLDTHRIIVSTPQVCLDGLRHGYINMGTNIGLIVLDEAHHAVDNHPYNRIMQEFYIPLPRRTEPSQGFGSFRPMVLGLTASPIFGSGDVGKAFRTIEANLDSKICTPRYHRNELAQYVHRPIFKYVPYTSAGSDDEPFSTNLATLSAIIEPLQIEDDPYVKSLRRSLSRASPTSSEYRRLDQKLSKVIMNNDSFTHKGLRDFKRAASDICHDMGSWAADWFVSKVVEKAKLAANPYNNIMASWKSEEKKYLLEILRQLVLCPVSYFDDDILDDTSDKVRVLIQCLLDEKEEMESLNQSFSGIVFVQRRDSVLALAEILSNHPFTKDQFSIGMLLGSSDSAYRHSLMDISRQLNKHSQESTLNDFKIGQKNLIISTSVAEEGIDIQSCGCVIRWDPPPNMASWIQSRGRARRQRSTFTLMYDIEEDIRQHKIEKWKELEQQMLGMYTDPSRLLPEGISESGIADAQDSDVELRIEATGAYLTPHSAVSHLSHFCAIISRSGSSENRPLYDIDPPDFIPGWHASDPRPGFQAAYEGPWGSKVTLPRSLAIPVREFETERIYRTKLAAYRHAAFKAYHALYDLKLLNDNLLPLSDTLDPALEEEVKSMLADIEKRAGMTNVGLQTDPWEEVGELGWHLSELTLNNSFPLLFFTRRPMEPFSFEEGPILSRPRAPKVRARLTVIETTIPLNDPILLKARAYTRMIFWILNGSHMDWDNTDFSYLFLPLNYETETEWHVRRSWLQELRADEEFRPDLAYTVAADTFMERFGHSEDLSIIRKNLQFGRAYRFVRWQHDHLSPEEEQDIKESYAKRCPDLEITYPLLVVEAYPPRTNFLHPLPTDVTHPTEKAKPIYFVAGLSGIVLASPEETEYMFLIPSVLRWLSIYLTMQSLRATLFADSPLIDIPTPLLTESMTASSSGEASNYQRLETLGDTVLKFVVGIQLFDEYPIWHEGYLTRKKDHAVSNVRLAKEDISRELYRWIVRDRMLGRKWIPKYLRVASDDVSPGERVQANIAQSEEESKCTEGQPLTEGSQPVEDEPPVALKKKKKQKGMKELSTKVLADVVESLIGAAYIHGGFNLGYECIKFFDLDLKWKPIPIRLAHILSNVQDDSEVPSQIADVEHMLGYTFERKILLIEALTHASYQEHIKTISYERMEFLGDSVLDMIVTDYLYHAPGKNYSPGHMHLRKSAVVNGHFLAYICLGLHRQYDALMPHAPQGDIRSANSEFVTATDRQEIYLWQCLLHSSQQVLNDQTNTFTRFGHRKDEIQDALQTGSFFPWAALTRLQAPKFFSDIIESVLGAIFIDSSGNLDIIKNVLRRLGILQVLERIVRDDVDILHPVSQLSMWAARNEKTIEYQFEKEKGNVACIIMIDGVEEVRETERYRGQASQEEVKFAAAEKAIRIFKLRSSNDAPRKKRKPKKKSKKEAK